MVFIPKVVDIIVQAKNGGTDSLKKGIIRQ